jgi:hypothetical protein
MQDQRRIEVYVCSDKADESVLDEFKREADIKDPEEIFEILVCDLCFRGKLQEGEHLVYFND